MNANKTEIVVKLGAMAVTACGETLVALGLGSCVAVILDDREAKLAGLAHVLLPSQTLSRDRSNPARSADTAVPRLVQLLCEQGASRERLTGWLVGGASMFADLLAAGTVHIGERNIAACRSGLREASVPIVGEAVGGQRSRSVWLDAERGVVTVRTVGGEPTTI
jgi:chemotaxis protein CheD